MHSGCENLYRFALSEPFLYPINHWLYRFSDIINTNPAVIMRQGSIKIDTDPSAIIVTHKSGSHMDEVVTYWAFGRG